MQADSIALMSRESGGYVETVDALIMKGVAMEARDEVETLTDNGARRAMTKSTFETCPQKVDRFLM